MTCPVMLHADCVFDPWRCSLPPSAIHAVRVWLHELAGVFEPDDVYRYGNALDGILSPQGTLGVDVRLRFMGRMSPSTSCAYTERPGCQIICFCHLNLVLARSTRDVAGMCINGRFGMLAVSSPKARLSQLKQHRVAFVKFSGVSTCCVCEACKPVCLFLVVSYYCTFKPVTRGPLLYNSCFAVHLKIWVCRHTACSPGMTSIWPAKSRS